MPRKRKVINRAGLISMPPSRDDAVVIGLPDSPERPPILLKLREEEGKRLRSFLESKGKRRSTSKEYFDTKHWRSGF